MRAPFIPISPFLSLFSLLIQQPLEGVHTPHKPHTVQVVHAVRRQEDRTHSTPPYRVCVCAFCATVNFVYGVRGGCRAGKATR